MPTTSNLDLTVDELDRASDDKIGGVVKVWQKNDVNRKMERAASWSQALHFLAGDQWIRYNAREHRWESIPYTDANRNIDRPVTNHLLRWVIINASSFTSRPDIVIDANSEEPEDKTAANVGEIITDFTWEDLEKDDSYYEAAIWGLTCGSVYRKSYKKNTGFYLAKPSDNTEELKNRGHESDASVEAGKYNDRSQMNGTMKDRTAINLKKLEVDIVSPFNMSFDGLPKRWRDVGIVMESQIKRLDWIKNQFGIDAEGYYPDNAAKVTEELEIDGVLSLGEGIKNIIEGHSYQSLGLKSAGYEITDSAVLNEVYVRPTAQHPCGQMIVTANNQLLFRGDSPYYYLGGKIWHPYTNWSYTKMIGQINGLSLVRQLIPIQRRVNSIDALLAYNRKTIATGKWLIPNGANVPDESLSGVPGQEIRYDADSTGAKPELLRGEPLPDQIIREREMLISDGDRIANASDIRSGENPKGVQTFGQLQILTEQSQLSMSKQTDSWEKFLQRSEQLDLLNFQDTYRVPDKVMIQQFKKFSKDITSFDWDNFIGSDLRDNASIVVTPGSTLRKSRTLRQQTILNLAKGGLLGDIVSDPYLHKDILEEFELDELLTENNIDVIMAEKAIEMMKQGKYPPVLEIHNPDVQLLVLLRYMKHPKYLEMQPEIKILFEERKDTYIKMLAEQPTAPASPSPAGMLPGAQPPAAPTPQALQTS